MPPASRREEEEVRAATAAAAAATTAGSFISAREAEDGIERGRGGQKHQNKPRQKANFNGGGARRNCWWSCHLPLGSQLHCLAPHFVELILL